MRRGFEADVGIESIKQRILERLRQVSTEHEFVKLIWLVIDVALEILKHGKMRLAIIVDDAFQLIGVKEAAVLIKGLLELIEHPEENYEKIVAVAATSEGLSKTEIGRHRWADIRAMWNMSREGFEELYKELRKKSQITCLVLTIYGCRLAETRRYSHNYIKSNGIRTQLYMH